MRRYAEDNQLWVVSHAGALVSELGESPLTSHIELDKELSETFAHDQDIFDTPPWKWPSR